MASRVYGIDLGSYSVKVVVALPGFRSATVIEAVERPIPPPSGPDDEPHEQRAVRVLGDIVRSLRLEEDSAYAAVPGDQVFIHVLDFAFRSLRRPDLERAVGAELEGILPVDLEDMVFAFDDLPRGVEADDLPPEAAQAAEGGEPSFVAAPARPQHARVAPPPAGMRVLACAMRTDRAREVIDRCGKVGVEPRGLVAAPLSYMRLAERLAACQASRSGGPPVAVIDIGHGRTNVCVVKEGRAVFARKIARGGRNLTAVIAKRWQIPFEEAEHAKHEDGFVASAAEPAPSEAWQGVSDVLVAELAPLARELRKTLTTCAAKTGAHVDSAVIVGGGSRLRGLASYLSEKLLIPVQTVAPADHEQVLGARLAQMGGSADTAALAAAVAFEGATGKPAFDLRQGELAPRADLSFLRSKLPQLATAALVIVAFATVNAYAAYYKHREAEAILAERLAIETTEVIGETLEASAAMRWIAEKAVPADSPLTSLTAYDELLIVNEAMPSREDAAIELREIDVSPGEIRIEATAESTEEVDGVAGISRMERAMREPDCFDDVSRGDISSSGDGKQRFSLTIETSCR